MIVTLIYVYSVCGLKNKYFIHCYSYSYFSEDRNGIRVSDVCRYIESIPSTRCPGNTVAAATATDRGPDAGHNIDHV